MSSQQRIFFDFLRFCVGATTEILPSTANIDWADFYQFAKKQSLLGVVFDGIQRLPKELAPDSGLLMKWMGGGMAIKRQNAVMYKASEEVFAEIRKAGLRCCILKGQGNAIAYPNRYARTAGDVDVWVLADRNTLRRLALDLAGADGRVEREIVHHIELDRKGVSVELHPTPMIFNNPVLNRRMQRWFRRNADLQCSNLVDLPDGMGRIAIPTAAFNVVYQLSHLQHHFFYEGVGMRQVVDYYFVLANMEVDWYIQSAELKRNLNGTSTSDFSFLNADNTNYACSADKNNQSAELKRNLNGNSTSDFSFLNADNTNYACSADKNNQSAELKRNLNGNSTSDFSFLNTDNTNLDALRHELKSLGLWTFAGAVMWVLHVTLGLPESMMIAPMDEKRGRLLLDEILEGGNFGQYGRRRHYGQGTLGHNVQRIVRDVQLVRYYPAEALAEPFFRVWHFLWRLSHR